MPLGYLFFISSAIGRATMSTIPPAGYAAMIVSGRSGYSAAAGTAQVSNRIAIRTRRMRPPSPAPELSHGGAVAIREGEDPVEHPQARSASRWPRSRRLWRNGASVSRPSTWPAGRAAILPEAEGGFKRICRRPPEGVRRPKSVADARLGNYAAGTTGPKKPSARPPSHVLGSCRPDGVRRRDQTAHDG